MEDNKQYYGFTNELFPQDPVDFRKRLWEKVNVFVRDEECDAAIKPTSRFILGSLFWYIFKYRPSNEWTLANMQKLILVSHPENDREYHRTPYDMIMEDVGQTFPEDDGFLWHTNAKMAPYHIYQSALVACAEIITNLEMDQCDMQDLFYNLLYNLLNLKSSK